MDGSFILGSGAPGGKGCGCSGPCDCLPAEFTRLRYSYGMRLGQVELSDEQSYLVGKDRFHNMHCHGSGVLCGLKVERFVWPQGAPASTPTTVLRVSRGAALDGCGREVLVPCDQCIDVAAWFAVNGGKIDPAPAAGALRIWVALRYRECPSDPAMVPRDSCGCGTGGCDYTRVRESFELCLFAGKSPTCAGAVFPDVASLATALNAADGTTPDGLRTRLDRLTAEPCPTGAADEWICLAAFDATVTAPGSGQTVTDITAPDNAITGRRPLLSTAALQTLVLGIANATGASGVLGAGPSINGITFTAGTSATTGTLAIGINLITDPPANSPTKLAHLTFQASMVQVRRFNSTTWAWDLVTPTSGEITTDDTKITIVWSTGDPQLLAGNYRVSLVSPAAAPIVDQLMRPLQPAQFARDFGLKLTGSTLELTEISV
jgi:hypothetical protein